MGFLTLYPLGALNIVVELRDVDVAVNGTRNASDGGRDWGGSRFCLFHVVSSSSSSAAAAGVHFDETILSFLF